MTVSDLFMESIDVAREWVDGYSLALGVIPGQT